MITVLEKPIPFGGGIALAPNKALSLEPTLTKANLPSLIKIPLCQHKDASAKVLVKVGELVLKGQLIAEGQGSISASVHASTSGVVKEIAYHALPNPSGEKFPCIVIETDGKETWVERNPIDDYKSLSPVEVQKKIWQAGVLDFGGSSFPAAGENVSGTTVGLELLILNAAECEPYISCDESLILSKAKEIVTGIEILAHALQINECVIAIEENKIEAIAVLKDVLEQSSKINIQLKIIPSLYPSGGEKQLIKSITGIEVPAESLPVDVGIVVYNVGKAVAVKKAIIDDEPLISRIVTVTGSGVNRACNMEVLLGAPINEIIEQCGGYNEYFEYLIMGGPMMGFRLDNDHVPLTKTTNCLLAAGSEFQSSNIKETACIRCDECVPVCPVNLQPQQLHWHANELNFERLEDHSLFDCIECGCCSYVCPSHISLVDEFRLAKSSILNKRDKQLEAEQNKKRYLNKQARLEQQKQDKIKKRAAVIDKKSDDDLAMKKKQDAIAAAVSRVKQKRKEINNS